MRTAPKAGSEDCCVTWWARHVPDFHVESLPIDETPRSGDHGAIKDGLGVDGPENVVVDREGNVRRESSDGASFILEIVGTRYQGDEIKPGVVRKLAALGISLGIEVYAVPQND